MKHYLLPVLFYCAAASAADTTIINVKANIVASPCTVSTATLNIDLGDIDANTLASAGNTSSWSLLNMIALTNCPVSTSTVKATFSGTPATNGDSNGYKNEGTGSTLSIQLADDNSTLNYLSNGKSTTDLPIINKAVNIPVRARLYTSGAATPGAVTASVNVAFEYK